MSRPNGNWIYTEAELTNTICVVDLATIGVA